MSQGVKLTFFSDSHLAPKFFKEINSSTFSPWASINTCLDGGVAYRPPVVQPIISRVSITIHLTLYTLTPIGIPKVPTRKIRLTIKSFFCGDHFLYSRDLNEWFVGDIVRWNKIPVTLGSSVLLSSFSFVSTQLSGVSLPSKLII